MGHNGGTVGSRRFVSEGDYAAYGELMSQWCREEGVAIWGYCPMPNHTHLIAVPGSEEGLLDSALPEVALRELRGHARTGRPLGDETFVERLERLVGRVLKPQKGGRPRRRENQ